METAVIIAHHIIYRRDEENELIARAKKINIETAEEEIQLVSRIKGGETTGDLVLDFCITTSGFLNKKLWEFINSINLKIANHQGEPVIVITKKEVSVRGAKPVTIDTSFFIGILSGGELVLNTTLTTFRSCMVPVGCYVAYSDILAKELTYFEKDISYRVMSSENAYPNVLIGHEKIKEFLTSIEGKNYQLSYQEGMHRLGHPLFQTV